MKKMKTVLRRMLPVMLLTPALALAMTPQETTLVRNAAERGDDGAQLMLGLEYLHGDGGLQKDASKAAYWLERSGARGNPAAQRMLGDLYARGNGVPKNLKLSADWWEKAANRGNSRAMLELGQLYMYGNDGVAKDLKKARYWLNRAAVEDNSEAKALLKQMPVEQEVEQHDPDLSGNLLASAAESGYDAVAEIVKFVRNSGYAFMETLHQHPVDLHKMAAEGDALSQYQLATRYESGYKEKQDYKQALYWFNKAAENGNVMAMKSLSHIYEKGLDGVKADPVLARQWADRADKAGK